MYTSLFYDIGFFMIGFFFHHDERSIAE